LSSRDDLLTIAEQRIIQLEIEIRWKNKLIQRKDKVIEELMAAQAGDRAKEVGTWEG